MAEQAPVRERDPSAGGFVQELTGPRFADWAYDFAHAKLAQLDPTCWRHVDAAVSRARKIAACVGDDAGLLIGVVALHDIGKAPELVRTGFTPLDGARFLQRLGAPRAAALVAHFGGGGVEAATRGFEREYRDFLHEASPVSDALWYCCLTSGPAGEPMTLDERLAALDGGDSGDPAATKYLTDVGLLRREAIARTEARLRLLTAD